MAAIEKFHIPEERLGGAHLDEARYLELYRRSIESPEEFWSQQAREFLA
ncbi:MAG: hypothetical protein DCC75_11265, partial [Proteobacteria bacterium]